MGVSGSDSHAMKNNQINQMDKWLTGEESLPGRDKDAKNLTNYLIVL